MDQYPGCARRVSIHAPRKGATAIIAVLGFLIFVSIHAPAQGGRLVTIEVTGDDRPHRFNPRPPQGGDPTPAACVLSASKFQSTPPRKGATSEFCHTLSDLYSFNPRPRAGGDKSNPRCRRRHHRFNPRPPQGGRLARVAGRLHFLVVSIHAPAQGGDTNHAASVTQVSVSIHAPRKGATELVMPNQADTLVSIHAPAQGGDAAGSGKWLFDADGFNPRPRARGRRDCRHVRPG